MLEKHCLYKTLRKYIAINYNIQIKENLLFNFYGGHTLLYFSNKNNKIPDITIKGNLIDEDLFLKNVGVPSNIIIENKNDSLNTTKNLLNKNKTQIVLVNCYFLPFDKQNFNKIYANHFLHIKKYCEETNTFIVSDNRYNDEIISLEQLDLARGNLLDAEGFYKYLEVDFSKNQLFEEDMYILNNKIMKTNAQKMLDTTIVSFNNIIYDIVEINTLPEPFRKVALHNIARAFKHPDAPGYSRYILSLNFKGELNSQLKEISDLWNKVPNDFIRLSKNTINIEDITNSLKTILRKEREINKEIIVHLETQ